MWEAACAEVWTQKSMVFSVRVCVSRSSEGVCGYRVLGRQSSGKSEEQPPQLWASGLSLWTAGWRGRCCLRAKGGRVSETRVQLVVHRMRSLQMLLLGN